MELSAKAPRWNDDDAVNVNKSSTMHADARDKSVKVLIEIGVN